jgi:hypothetical protein
MRQGLGPFCSLFFVLNIYNGAMPAVSVNLLFVGAMN